ncbi:MAG: class I SAM-dependent methyltransferase [Alphaproteobacteria bacterium]
MDSFIRRVVAQRDCLNAVAGMISQLPGPVLELGLGNGRTYDHLRELLPEREIFVFDRRVAAHPDCIPDAGHLFLGDILEQLPVAGARLGGTVALAHSDIGTGVAERDARIAAALGPCLMPLMRPGGLVLSDQELRTGAWRALPLPAGVPEGRYFMYRADA